MSEQHSQFQDAKARWSKLPPIVRIGALLAVVIVFFVIVNDYSWQTAARLSDEAGTIARTLDRAKAARDDLRSDLERTVIATGPVRLPVDETVGVQAMADAINEIVQRRSGLSAYSYDSGGITRLPQNILRDVLRPGDRAARASGEVKFDATPDVAMSVIAEIESNPAIQGISRVQMSRLGVQRRVAVQLTVETWVIARSDGPGRFGR